MAGLTDEGFEPKPLADIQTDLGSGLRAVFGAAITLIAQSVFGQIIGIIAERLADLWQLGLALYNAGTREGAVGIQLDNIGALTGTARLQATNTHVQVLCITSAAIPANSLVSIPGVGTQFTNDVISGSPVSGQVTVDFRAVNTGALAAPSGTVTHIDTPVSGWTSCSNPLDENILGSDIETDAVYRIRQVAELRAMGASTIAAIRAKLFGVPNVTDAYVFDNDSDSTDGNGLTPHSFECVVDGGTDAAVSSVILLNKPVGIATHGTSTTSATDANGFSIAVNYSRPAELDAYLIVNLSALAASYPSNGDDLVKDAIVSYGINYHTGSALIPSALIPNIFAATAGVTDVSIPLVGTAINPSTSAPIVATNRQKVKLDTSRIVINHTLV